MSLRELVQGATGKEFHPYLVKPMYTAVLYEAFFRRAGSRLGERNIADSITIFFNLLLAPLVDILYDHRLKALGYSSSGPADLRLITRLFSTADLQSSINQQSHIASQRIARKMIRMCLLPTIDRMYSRTRTSNSYRIIRRYHTITTTPNVYVELLSVFLLPLMSAHN